MGHRKKYIVLELNRDLPIEEYSKYRIDGKVHESAPVYDFSRHIAIEA